MEDIVTFELAKKLKEKGFPQSPDYFNYSSYFDWDGLRKIHSLSNASVWFDPNIIKDNIYFAPTISQVLKWLRKEKRLSVEPFYYKGGKWFATIAKIDSDNSLDDVHLNYGNTSYEEAAMKGVNYVLDNLI